MEGAAGARAGTGFLLAGEGEHATSPKGAAAWVAAVEFAIAALQAAARASPSDAKARRVALPATPLPPLPLPSHYLGDSPALAAAGHGHERIAWQPLALLVASGFREAGDGALLLPATVPAARLQARVLELQAALPVFKAAAALATNLAACRLATGAVAARDALDSKTPHSPARPGLDAYADDGMGEGGEGEEYGVEAPWQRGSGTGAAARLRTGLDLGGEGDPSLPLLLAARSGNSSPNVSAIPFPQQQAAGALRGRPGALESPARAHRAGRASSSPERSFVRSVSPPRAAVEAGSSAGGFLRAGGELDTSAAWLQRQHLQGLGRGTRSLNGSASLLFDGAGFGAAPAAGVSGGGMSVTQGMAMRASETMAMRASAQQQQGAHLAGSLRSSGASLRLGAPDSLASSGGSHFGSAARASVALPPAAFPSQAPGTLATLGPSASAEVVGRLAAENASLRAAAEGRIAALEGALAEAQAALRTRQLAELAGKFRSSLGGAAAAAERSAAGSAGGAGVGASLRELGTSAAAAVGLLRVGGAAAAALGAAAQPAPARPGTASGSAAPAGQTRAASAGRAGAAAKGAAGKGAGPAELRVGAEGPGSDSPFQLAAPTRPDLRAVLLRRRRPAQQAEPAPSAVAARSADLPGIGFDVEGAGAEGLGWAAPARWPRAGQALLLWVGREGAAPVAGGGAGRERSQGPKVAVAARPTPAPASRPPPQPPAAGAAAGSARQSLAQQQAAQPQHLLFFVTEVHDARALEADAAAAPASGALGGDLDACDEVLLTLHSEVGAALPAGSPVSIEASPDPAAARAFARSVIEAYVASALLPSLVDAAAEAGEARGALRRAEQAFCHRRVPLRLPTHALLAEHEATLVAGSGCCVDVPTPVPCGAGVLLAQRQHQDITLHRYVDWGSGEGAAGALAAVYRAHLDPGATDAVPLSILVARGTASAAAATLLSSQATVPTHAVWTLPPAAADAAAMPVPQLTLAQVWQRLVDASARLAPDSTLLSAAAGTGRGLSDSVHLARLNVTGGGIAEGGGDAPFSCNAFCALFRPLHPFDHITLPEASLELLAAAHPHPASEVLALTTPEYWGAQWEAARAACPLLDEGDLAAAAAAFARAHAVEFAETPFLAPPQSPLLAPPDLATLRARATRLSLEGARAVCLALDGDAPSASELAAFVLSPAGRRVEADSAAKLNGAGTARDVGLDGGIGLTDGSTPGGAVSAGAAEAVGVTFAHLMLLRATRDSSLLAGEDGSAGDAEGLRSGEGGAAGTCALGAGPESQVLARMVQGQLELQHQLQAVTASTEQCGAGGMAAALADPLLAATNVAMLQERRTGLPAAGSPRLHQLLSAVGAAYRSAAAAVAAAPMPRGGSRSSAAASASAVTPQAVVDVMNRTDAGRRLLQLPLALRSGAASAALGGGLPFVTARSVLLALQGMQQHVSWHACVGALLAALNQSCESSAGAPAAMPSSTPCLPPPPPLLTAGAPALEGGRFDQSARGPGAAGPGCPSAVPLRGIAVVDAAVSASGAVVYTLASDGWLTATDALSLGQRWRVQALPAEMAAALLRCRDAAARLGPLGGDDAAAVRLPAIGSVLHCPADTTPLATAATMVGMARHDVGSSGTAAGASAAPLTHASLPVAVSSTVPFAGEPACTLVLNASAALLAVYATGARLTTLTGAAAGASSGAAAAAAANAVAAGGEAEDAEGSWSELRWLLDTPGGGHTVARLTPRFAVGQSLSTPPALAPFRARSPDAGAASGRGEVQVAAGSRLLLSELALLPHMHAAAAVARPLVGGASSGGGGAWPRLMAVCCLTGFAVADFGPLLAGGFALAHPLHLPHAAALLVCESVQRTHRLPVWEQAPPSPTRRRELDSAAAATGIREGPADAQPPAGWSGQEAVMTVRRPWLASFDLHPLLSHLAAQRRAFMGTAVQAQPSDAEAGEGEGDDGAAAAAAAQAAIPRVLSVAPSGALDVSTAFAAFASADATALALADLTGPWAAADAAVHSAVYLPGSRCIALAVALEGAGSPRRRPGHPSAPGSQCGVLLVEAAHLRHRLKLPALDAATRAQGAAGAAPASLCELQALSGLGVRGVPGERSAGLDEASDDPRWTPLPPGYHPTAGAAAAGALGGQERGATPLPAFLLAAADVLRSCCLSPPAGSAPAALLRLACAPLKGQGRGPSLSSVPPCAVVADPSACATAAALAAAVGSGAGGSDGSAFAGRARGRTQRPALGGSGRRHATASSGPPASACYVYVLETGAVAVVEVHPQHAATAPPAAAAGVNPVFDPRFVTLSDEAFIAGGGALAQLTPQAWALLKHLALQRHRVRRVLFLLSRGAPCCLFVPAALQAPGGHRNGAATALSNAGAMQPALASLPQLAQALLRAHDDTSSAVSGGAAVGRALSTLPTLLRLLGAASGAFDGGASALDVSGADLGRGGQLGRAAANLPLLLVPFYAPGDSPASTLPSCPPAALRQPALSQGHSSGLLHAADLASLRAAFGQPVFAGTVVEVQRLAGLAVVAMEHEDACVAVPLHAVTLLGSPQGGAPLPGPAGLSLCAGDWVLVQLGCSPHPSPGELEAAAWLAELQTGEEQGPARTDTLVVQTAEAMPCGDAALGLPLSPTGHTLALHRACTATYLVGAGVSSVRVHDYAPPALLHAGKPSLRRGLRAALAHHLSSSLLPTHALAVASARLARRQHAAVVSRVGQAALQAVTHALLAAHSADCGRSALGDAVAGIALSFQHATPDAALPQAVQAAAAALLMAPLKVAAAAPTPPPAAGGLDALQLLSRLAAAMWHFPLLRCAGRALLSAPAAPPAGHASSGGTAQAALRAATCAAPAGGRSLLNLTAVTAASAPGRNFAGGKEEEEGEEEGEGAAEGAGASRRFDSSGVGEGRGAAFSGSRQLRSFVPERSAGAECFRSLLVELFEGAAEEAGGAPRAAASRDEVPQLRVRPAAVLAALTAACGFAPRLESLLPLLGAAMPAMPAAPALGAAAATTGSVVLAESVAESLQRRGATPWLQLAAEVAAAAGRAADAPELLLDALSEGADAVEAEQEEGEGEGEGGSVAEHGTHRGAAAGARNGGGRGAMAPSREGNSAALLGPQGEVRREEQAHLALLAASAVAALGALQGCGVSSVPLETFDPSAAHELLAAVPSTGVLTAGGCAALGDRVLDAASAARGTLQAVGQLAGAAHALAAASVASAVQARVPGLLQQQRGQQPSLSLLPSLLDSAALGADWSPLLAAFARNLRLAAALAAPRVGGALGPPRPRLLAAGPAGGALGGDSAAAQLTGVQSSLARLSHTLSAHTTVQGLGASWLRRFEAAAAALLSAAAAEGSGYEAGGTGTSWSPFGLTTLATTARGQAASFPGAATSFAAPSSSVAAAPFPCLPRLLPVLASGAVEGLVAVAIAAGAAACRLPALSFDGPRAVVAACGELLLGCLRLLQQEWHAGLRALAAPRHQGAGATPDHAGRGEDAEPLQAAGELRRGAEAARVLRGLAAVAAGARRLLRALLHLATGRLSGLADDPLTGVPSAAASVRVAESVFALHPSGGAALQLAYVAALLPAVAPLLARIVGGDGRGVYALPLVRAIIAADGAHSIPEDASTTAADGTVGGEAGAASAAAAAVASVLFPQGALSDAGRDPLCMLAGCRLLAPARPFLRGLQQAAAEARSRALLAAAEAGAGAADSDAMPAAAAAAAQGQPESFLAAAAGFVGGAGGSPAAAPGAARAAPCAFRRSAAYWRELPACLGALRHLHDGVPDPIADVPPELCIGASLTEKGASVHGGGGGSSGGRSKAGPASARTVSMHARTAERVAERAQAAARLRALLTPPPLPGSAGSGAASAASGALPGLEAAGATGPSAEVDDGAAGDGEGLPFAGGAPSGAAASADPSVRCLHRAALAWDMSVPTLLPALLYDSDHGVRLAALQAAEGVGAWVAQHAATPAEAPLAGGGVGALEGSPSSSAAASVATSSGVLPAEAAAVRAWAAVAAALSGVDTTMALVRRLLLYWHHAGRSGAAATAAAGGAAGSARGSMGAGRPGGSSGGARAAAALPGAAPESDAAALAATTLLLHQVRLRCACPSTWRACGVLPLLVRLARLGTSAAALAASLAPGEDASLAARAPGRPSQPSRPALGDGGGRAGAAATPSDVAVAASAALRLACTDAYNGPLLALVRAEPSVLSWAASAEAGLGTGGRGGLAVASDAAASWGEVSTLLVSAAARFVTSGDASSPRSAGSAPLDAAAARRGEDSFAADSPRGAPSAGGDGLRVPSGGTEVAAAIEAFAALQARWHGIGGVLLGRLRDAVEAAQPFSTASLGGAGRGSFEDLAGECETAALSLWTLATVAWRLACALPVGHPSRAAAASMVGAVLALLGQALEQGLLAASLLLGAPGAAQALQAASGTSDDAASSVAAAAAAASSVSAVMWPGVALLCEALGSALQVRTHDLDPARLVQARAGALLGGLLQLCVGPAALGATLAVGGTTPPTAAAQRARAWPALRSLLACSLVHCALRAGVCGSLAQAIGGHCRWLRAVMAARTTHLHAALGRGSLLLEGMSGRSCLLAALLQLALAQPTPAGQDAVCAAFPSLPWAVLRLPHAVAVELATSGVFAAAAGVMLDDVSLLDAAHAALPPAVAASLAGRHPIRLEGVGLLWLLGCLLLQAQARAGSNPLWGATGNVHGGSAPDESPLRLLQGALARAVAEGGVVGAERSRLWRLRDAAVHPTVCAALQALVLGVGTLEPVRASLHAIGVPAAAFRGAQAARALFAAQPRTARAGDILPQGGAAAAEGAFQGHGDSGERAIAAVAGGTAPSGAAAFQRALGEFAEAEAAALRAWARWQGEKAVVAPSIAEQEASEARAAGDSAVAEALAAGENVALRGTASGGWIAIAGGGLAPLAASDSVAARLATSMRRSAEASAVLAASVNPSSRAGELGTRGQMLQPASARPVPRDEPWVAGVSLAFASPTIAASPPPAPPAAGQAVAATAAVLERLGEAVVDVKAAFDAACTPGGATVSADAASLGALLAQLGQSYGAALHAAALVAGALPGAAASTGLTFSQFVRLLGFAMDRGA
jgi:hypothetical protein